MQAPLQFQMHVHLSLQQWPTKFRKGRDMSKPVTEVSCSQLPGVSGAKDGDFDDLLG